MYQVLLYGRYHQLEKSSEPIKYMQALEAADRLKRFYPNREVYVIDSETGEIVWG